MTPAKVAAQITRANRAKSRVNLVNMTEYEAMTYELANSKLAQGEYIKALAAELLFLSLD